MGSKYDHARVIFVDWSLIHLYGCRYDKLYSEIFESENYT